MLEECLARIFDLDEAQQLLRKVRYPQQDVPGPAKSRVFWSKVFADIDNGVSQTDVYCELLDAALDNRPGNEELTAIRLLRPHREPDWPMYAPRELVVHNIAGDLAKFGPLLDGIAGKLSLDKAMALRDVHRKALVVARRIFERDVELWLVADTFYQLTAMGALREQLARSIVPFKTIPDDTAASLAKLIGLDQPDGPAREAPPAPAEALPAPAEALPALAEGLPALAEGLPRPEPRASVTTPLIRADRLLTGRWYVQRVTGRVEHRGVIELDTHVDPTNFAEALRAKLRKDLLVGVLRRPGVISDAELARKVEKWQSRYGPIYVLVLDEQPGLDIEALRHHFPWLTFFVLVPEITERHTVTMNVELVTPVVESATEQEWFDDFCVMAGRAADVREAEE